jgi:hypothetical protein
MDATHHHLRKSLLSDVRCYMIYVKPKHQLRTVVCEVLVLIRMASMHLSLGVSLVWDASLANVKRSNIVRALQLHENAQL